MSQKMTLEQFFNRKGMSATELRKNLEANMEAVVGDELDKETKETLMRVNLIMIRQCLQDYGDEA